MIMWLTYKSQILTLESIKIQFYFQKPQESNKFDKWLNAMKDELKSMEQNKVWDLFELPKRSKRVGC